MSEAYLDRLDGIDAETEEGTIAGLKILQEGVQAYQDRFVKIINTTPGVDVPLAMAAFKLAYDAFYASLSEPARESVEAILALPFSTTLAYISGGAGHE